MWSFVCLGTSPCLPAAAQWLLACAQGRNVVLESKYGSPKIVNDGVTVAKEVELEDPVENIGAKLVRQVRPSLLMHSSRTAGPCSGRVRGGGHCQRVSMQCWARKQQCVVMTPSVASAARRLSHLLGLRQQ